MAIIELPSDALLFFLSFLLMGVIFYIRSRTWLHQSLPPSPLALPVIGHLHLLGPLIHRSFHDLSSRYGPLVYIRLGSVPGVVVSDPELAKEFLRSHELTFSSRKQTVAVFQITYNSSFIFAPFGPFWKYIKKLSTAQLLSTRSLNKFLPIRTKELHQFLRHLAEKAETGERVNVTDELLKLINNIFSQMMLSYRSSGTDRQAEEVRTLVRETTKVSGEVNVSDFIWFFRNLDLQGFKKRIQDIQRRYDALLEKLITDRDELRKTKPRREMACDGGDHGVKDFLDVLLDAFEDKSSGIRITRNHIKAVILEFLTGSTDTSAALVEWAFAELINHPKVLKKAKKEIDEVVGMNRIVEESDIPNLPYIQAIMKEALRLHPPFPVLARKSVEDCTINGYTIPSGVFLFVNIWSIGRDPKHWDNPTAFMPERFLHSNASDKAGVIDVKGQHFQLLPFGTGRRICPGLSLAMQELPTVLAAMIQCFDWRAFSPSGIETDTVDMTERPGLTVPRAYDLVCVPTARMRTYNDILTT